MAVVKLKSLSLEAFRSFNDESTIQFPESGIVLLQGINHDTKGSSGAGKSTIPLAINYALGACSIPSTELQSWINKLPPAVSLGLEIDGKEVEISRSKKFDLLVGGEPTAGSIKQKEAALEQLIGIPTEMLMALTYRGQRKPGLFLSKTDSEKKEFLTQLLGLDRFEKAVEDSNKKVTVLENELVKLNAEKNSLINQSNEFQFDPEDNGLEGRLGIKKQELTAFEKDLVRLQENLAELNKDIAGEKLLVAKEFKDKAIEIHKQWEELKASWVYVPQASGEIASHKQTIAQIAERISKLEKEDQARRSELETSKFELNQKFTGYKIDISNIPEVQKQIERLESQYKTLEDDKCPTCERVWDKAKNESDVVCSQIDTLKNKLQELQDMVLHLKALKEEIAGLPVFEPNILISQLRDTKTAFTAKLAAAEKGVEQDKQVQKALHDKRLSDLMALEQGIMRQGNEAASGVDLVYKDTLANFAEMLEKRKISIHATKLSIVETEGRLKQFNYKKDQKNKLDAKIELLDLSVQGIDTQLRAQKDFLGVIGREGFLGSIFDEVLSEISDETNRILGAVANTRHCTLQFRSENMTQKGTIKKEIRPIVTVNGFEAPLTSGLSGGMLSTVELAVDLAVSEVIARRAGVSIAYQILDESFDGLDAVSKESCLEILHTHCVKNKKVVLIIDHSESLHGFSDYRIKIEYKGGESRVVK